MNELMNRAVSAAPGDMRSAASSRDNLDSKLAILAARFGLDSTFGGGQLGRERLAADLRPGWNFLRKRK
jgi:hypothetical protein